ncbi:MAG: hypothetical protein ACREMS_02405 [Gemmatimonadaceae bacterium]
MKDTAVLTIASVLAILLSSLHLADDIVRGFEKGGVGTLFGVLVFAIWLYGTLALAGRRSGYIIILLGSILGLAAPVVHMMGRGVGSQVANSNGAFFFAWTLIAIGVSALFSATLAAHRLWSVRSALDG